MSLERGESSSGLPFLLVAVGATLGMFVAFLGLLLGTCGGVSGL